MSVVLSPDGVRYLAIADGRRVARPFHYRWLLPFLCRTSEARWTWTARISALVVCVEGAVWCRSWWAALIPLGLAGVVRVNVVRPVLVDLPAMALSLGAAICAREHWWPAAVALAVVAGAVKESGPVFAALWAWHPILLVGLLSPAVRHTFWRSGPDPLDAENARILAHPIRTAVEYHRPIPAWVYLLPWGALLTAGATLDHRALAVLAAAYAQCAVATDTVRLYQWAWPALAPLAVAAIPAAWLPLALALHLANPWRTEGI